MTALPEAIADAERVVKRAGLTLPPIEYCVDVAPRARALAWYHRGIIAVAEDVLSAPEPLLRAVLLHELAHAVLRGKGDRHHGRDFLAVCRRLARSLRTKGPRSASESRVWPWMAVAVKLNWRLPPRPPPQAATTPPKPARVAAAVPIVAQRRPLSLAQAVGAIVWAVLAVTASTMARIRAIRRATVARARRWSRAHPDLAAGVDPVKACTRHREAWAWT